MLLKRHLDAFLENFPKQSHLANDPVQFVRIYDNPADREIVGLLAAVFAYGNVKIVLRTVRQIADYLGPKPREFIAGFDLSSDARKLDRFYHRFNTARDLGVLFWIMRRTLEDHGSFEGAFAAGLSQQDSNVGSALDRFSETLLGYGHEQFYPKGELKRRLGVHYLFPAPSHRSACKRLNLYLRWMVRPEDGIDCGVWTRVAPRQLVIPLDTHIARISSYIGLTDMRTPGWSMAVDITRSLSKLHFDDPLRYDFALCHLGIAGDCPRKRDLRKCGKCPIQAVCRL